MLQIYCNQAITVHSDRNITATHTGSSNKSTKTKTSILNQQQQKHIDALFTIIGHWLAVVNDFTHAHTPGQLQ